MGAVYRCSRMIAGLNSGTISVENVKSEDLPPLEQNLEGKMPYETCGPEYIRC